MRRAAGGLRSEVVRYGRFSDNLRVTVEALLAGWSEQTAPAAAGRHVLAIQDTSEINFRTTAERHRGLGEIGKGVGRGVLRHAMLALDAATDSCLGLGQVWTRPGRVTVAHDKRRLADKESQRWLSTAEQAKEVLANAAMVTVIADRESESYAEWLPERNFHLLTRSMQDRTLADGGSLYEAGARLPIAAVAGAELPARAHRPARTARLALRFGSVTLRKPRNTLEPDVPKAVPLSLVVEPAGRRGAGALALAHHPRGS